MTALGFLLAALAMGAWAVLALKRIGPGLRARDGVERVLRWCILAASAAAILTTLAIVLSILFEALRFFQRVPLGEFLFGLEWSPQTAIREDQVGSSGAFGAVPLFTGTLLVAGIAMLLAAPTGIMIAVYLSEYAQRRTRALFRPLLEVLAGIPPVVYGYFAALVVSPALRTFSDSRAGQALGLDLGADVALVAGLVLGIMIVPMISSISGEVIGAAPKSLREASLAVGATRSETMLRVVLPAVFPGILAGVLLAASRAIGETMIVLMAAGLAANLTFNPLDTVTTMTVQIATLLTGDQEFDSAKTLAAFALGLMLLVVTTLLNLVAATVARRYRAQYP